MELKIEEIDYHRNGSGGEGFVAVRFMHDGDPMLATVFRQPGCCAVVNRVLAAETIQFGRNSWRGDVYEGALRDAIAAWWLAEHGSTECPFGGPSWPPKPQTPTPSFKLCSQCAHAGNMNGTLLCTKLADPLHGGPQPADQARRYQCGVSRALYWTARPTTTKEGT